MRTKDTIAKLAAKNDAAQAELRRHVESYLGHDGPEGRKLKRKADRAWLRLIHCVGRIVK